MTLVRKDYFTHQTAFTKQSFFFFLKLLEGKKKSLKMPPLSFFRFRYLRGVCVFRHRSASRGVRHGGEDPGQQRGDHGGAEAVPAGVLRQTLRGGEEEPPARQQRPGQHLLGGGAAERIQPDVAGRFTVRGRFLFFSLSLTVTRGNTQRAAEPLGYLSNNGIANPPLQETPRFVPLLINRPPSHLSRSQVDPHSRDRLEEL